MTSAGRGGETVHPEDYRDWLRALRAEERRRVENGEPDWLSPEQRLRAEQQERERAAGSEWKAFRNAGVAGTRGPGRPAADTEGLVNAAVWQTHLFPGKTRPRGFNDVVDELLASPVDAVRALVGKSKRKTLRNRLANRHDVILQPDWSDLTDAEEWAEQEGLPALLPLEAASGVKFVRATRIRPEERDGLLLAEAVHQQGVAEQLPPKAREVLWRLLERLEEDGVREDLRFEED